MVTKEQSLSTQEFHQNGCTMVYGARGGITEHIFRVRRNGATKTWKRQPERFRVPVKHGLSTYGYITDDNAYAWHADNECPLLTASGHACPNYSTPHTCHNASSCHA